MFVFFLKFIWITTVLTYLTHERPFCHDSLLVFFLTMNKL
jgi:hypothetical protein